MNGRMKQDEEVQFGDWVSLVLVFEIIQEQESPSRASRIIRSQVKDYFTNDIN